MITKKVIQELREWNWYCKICKKLMRSGPYCWEKHMEEFHKEKYNTNLFYDGHELFDETAYTLGIEMDLVIKKIKQLERQLK